MHLLYLLSYLYEQILNSLKMDSGEKEKKKVIFWFTARCIFLFDFNFPKSEYDILQKKVELFKNSFLRAANSNLFNVSINGYFFPLKSK